MPDRDGVDQTDLDAPICPWCGVTALPGGAAGRSDAAFVCDDADCPGFGEPVSG